MNPFTFKPQTIPGGGDKAAGPFSLWAKPCGGIRFVEHFTGIAGKFERPYWGGGLTDRPEDRACLATWALAQYAELAYFDGEAFTAEPLEPLILFEICA